MVVSLSAPSSSVVAVDFNQSNGSAIAAQNGGSDYIRQSGSLTFAPGETTKTVRLELINDQTAEFRERFSFTLSSPTNATIARASSTVQIIDNDTIVDTPQVFVTDVAVDEKAGTATFEVRLGHSLGESSPSTVQVSYTTADSTALAGQDYLAKTGTLSFAPGESVKLITVDVIDDRWTEAAERFNLRLSGAVNASLADGSGVAEIGRSDSRVVATPVIQLDDQRVSESDGYVEVVVRLSAPSATVVTVNQGLAGRTAGFGTEFVGSSSVLTFAPGEVLKSVRIDLIDDRAVEPEESFNVTLSSANGASIGNSSALISIVDNDGTVPAFSFGRSDDIYETDLPAGIVEGAGAGGGFDTLRSSVNVNLPDGLEGIVLTGTAVSAVGNAAANHFQGNALNNTFNGGAGTDTVAVAGPLANYTIGGGLDALTVSGPGNGTDTYVGIERLRFTDIMFAVDTTPTGNTYQAYAMLNAAFNAAPTTGELSRWTAQLDRLGDLTDLAQAMINFYAPGVSNDVLVSHLWSTIVETPLSAGDLTNFVGLIENGTFSQASLLSFVTTHPLNTDELVSIVGTVVQLDPNWFPPPI